MKNARMGLVVAAVLTVGSVSCHAQAVGNVFPKYPSTTEGQQPLPDVNKIPFLNFYTLAAGKHFESDPSSSSQAASKDGKFIFQPRVELFGGVISIDNPKFLEANVYFHLTQAREFARSIGAYV